MMELLSFVVKEILVPVGLGVLTYLLVDRLGEWKKRRNYSRLGVAILYALLEEVRTGIRVMNEALSSATSDSASGPPVAALPSRSWSGMSSISDEVLLRIIATTWNQEYDGLPPVECRIHCKNYFEMMNANYQQAIAVAVKQARQGEDWQRTIRNLLEDDSGHYIQATGKVELMLENARQALLINANRSIPK